jgi:hypothetical protein
VYLLTGSLLMIIDDLNWNSSLVGWTFKGESKTFCISNIMHANVEENYINVVCGEKNSEDEVFNISFEGIVQFYYNKNTGKTFWLHNGLKVDLVLNSINNAKIYKGENLVLCITSNTNGVTKLLGYSTDGKLIFEKDEPVDLKFLYLSVANNHPSIVCEGDAKHTDKFGRSTHHVLVNKNNGYLTWANLAY